MKRIKHLTFLLCNANLKINLARHKFRNYIFNIIKNLQATRINKFKWFNTLKCHICNYIIMQYCRICFLYVILFLTSGLDFRYFILHWLVEEWLDRRLPNNSILSMILRDTIINLIMLSPACVFPSFKQVFLSNHLCEFKTEFIFNGWGNDTLTVLLMIKYCLVLFINTICK